MAPSAIFIPVTDRRGLNRCRSLIIESSMTSEQKDMGCQDTCIDVTVVWPPVVTQFLKQSWHLQDIRYLRMNWSIMLAHLSLCCHKLIQLFDLRSRSHPSVISDPMIDYKPQGSSQLNLDLLPLNETFLPRQAKRILLQSVLETRVCFSKGLMWHFNFLFDWIGSSELCWTTLMLLCPGVEMMNKMIGQQQRRSNHQWTKGEIKSKLLNYSLWHSVFCLFLFQSRDSTTQGGALVRPAQCQVLIEQHLSGLPGTGTG